MAGGEHLEEPALPALDELEGVGEDGLAGQAGWEGIFGHEHVRDQLVPELVQALQNCLVVCCFKFYRGG